MTDHEIDRLIKPIPRLKQRRRMHRVRRVIDTILRDGKRARGGHDRIDRMFETRDFVAYLKASLGQMP